MNVLPSDEVLDESAKQPRSTAASRKVFMSDKAVSNSFQGDAIPSRR
ncbi:hypothetical protein MM3A0810R_0215 [Mycobacteroides abscessus 3A-0810-R]|nr:hypothetical protein MA3A0122R_0273 [Mycobacteroides abscessus 3A-0122-R]EIV62013.1 hypothetical protein MA3A0930R_0215 [Mycobacteroides abscessus 3A-0930-R]EIV84200.1 hypothetical protein MM3A0810R_0215 [Mycobacteroides abscessus 3A-0810-R]EUA72892.1 hypothetical protein I541_5100 [Mycobacteroides abscessus]